MVENHPTFYLGSFRSESSAAVMWLIHASYNQWHSQTLYDSAIRMGAVMFSILMNHGRFDGVGVKPAPGSCLELDIHHDVVPLPPTSLCRSHSLSSVASFTTPIGSTVSFDTTLKAHQDVSIRTCTATPPV